MKLVLIAIALLGSAAFANNEKISDASDLTCQQAIGQVKRNGHKKFVVGGSVKEYYSADAADDFCTGWQRANQAWIATGDAANCPVGFTCVNK